MHIILYWKRNMFRGIFPITRWFILNGSADHRGNMTPKRRFLEMAVSNLCRPAKTSLPFKRFIYRFTLIFRNFGSMKLVFLWSDFRIFVDYKNFQIHSSFILIHPWKLGLVSWCDDLPLRPNARWISPRTSWTFRVLTRQEKREGFCHSKRWRVLHPCCLQ